MRRHAWTLPSDCIYWFFFIVLLLLLFKTLALKMLKKQPQSLLLNKLLQRCTFHYDQRKSQTGNTGIFITTVVWGGCPPASCCPLIGGHERCRKPDGAVSASNQQQIKFLKRESKGLGTDVLCDVPLVRASEIPPETLPRRSSVSLETENSCKTESGLGEQLRWVWLPQFWRAEQHKEDRQLLSFSS